MRAQIDLTICNVKDRGHQLIVFVLTDLMCLFFLTVLNMSNILQKTTHLMTQHDQYTYKKLILNINYLLYFC